MPGYTELPFVASFSQERDSLATGDLTVPQGNGVCIGFRSASIQWAYLEKAKKGVCLAGLWPITYLGTDDLKVLDDMINKELLHSIRLIEEMESARGTIATDRDKVGLLRAELEMRAGRTKQILYS